MSDGKRQTHEVEPTDTILSLKCKLRAKERIPVKRMRLVSAGRILENDKTLLDYKIQKEATLQYGIRFGGSTYCQGCILPSLICLSANVSLQCGEKLSFDNKRLLCSIKTKLNNLNNDAINIIITCIGTCGYLWDEIECDDAEFFQDHEARRKSEAIEKFTSAICAMIQPYLKEYRSIEKLELINQMDIQDIQNALNSNVVDKPIDVDWLTFLHETRCPICFCRFTDVQSATNIPNRMPMALCSISDKHIVCQECCEALRLCPLCNGALVENLSPSQSMLNAIASTRKKLEDYCFPANLAREIVIQPNQQPIAHGAIGQIFCVKDKYAVKCALVANTIDTEEALIHEIAVSRPLAHIPQLVTVYGGVRLPQHGIGIVMEYINGPSLAAALIDSSRIIRNLSMKARLHIALGIAQGLGELHLAKLVHRDLKPENILLVQSNDGAYKPKLADFGVSFQLAIASATAVKDSCGTVGYDAPEVVNDGKTPTAASDIYALAFTLYELLTAKRVFTGLKSAQILSRFTMRGERPRDWPTDVPIPMRQAIEQAWATEPAQRATIGTIIHAIRRSLNPNQLSCIQMLKKIGESRARIATVQWEDLQSFDLFALDELVKRMTIDDCEAIHLFISHF